MIAKGDVWGIDIGRSTLKAIRMRGLRTSVEITGVDVIDYYGSAEEPPSPAEIRQALAQFRQRNKVKASDIVAVAVAGYAAFTRFIKLPPVEDKKIADVVKYEAAQQIPFPLSDVVWSYQKVERAYSPGEDVDVGIYAIREEIVRELLANFDAAKMHVDIITIAPLALFNFARYEMEIPEEAVVVDIGADHTDLVVVEGEKFHVRNLPLAGNDITKRLMEEFEVSFLEAEKLKIKAAKAKQSDKLFAVMQPVLRDFVGEIMRSLSFYKSKAAQMILLGNATRLEGLAKFFADNLETTINRFFDIVHMELAHDVDVTVLQEFLPSFGVAIGLALQAVGKGASQINLMPQKLYKQRQIQRKQPMFLTAAVLLFLLVLFMYFSGRSRISTLEDSYQKADIELRALKRIEKLEKNVGEYASTRAESEELVRFVKQRKVPIELINKINQAVPVGQADLPVTLQRKYREDLYPPYPDEEMDAINKDKAWLLGLEMNHVQEGEPGMEIVLTAALIADAREVDTVNRLKTIFLNSLAEQFGLQPDDMRKALQNPTVRTLSLDKSVDQRPDGSNQTYFKFELRWKVPYATDKGEEPEEGASGEENP